METGIPETARYNQGLGSRIKEIIEERYGSPKTFAHAAHTILQLAESTTREYIKYVTDGFILGTPTPNVKKIQERANRLSRLLHLLDIPTDDPLIDEIRKNASGYYEFNFPLE